MRTFGFVALVFVLCLHALKLEAANIYKVTSRDGGPTNAIALEGRIEDGDFNKYAALISKHPRLSGVLILHSPGGNLFKKIKIGRLVRQLSIATSTSSHFSGRSLVLNPAKNPNNSLCASSCFFIWIAGTSRGGDKIDVHRPRPNEQVRGSLDPDGMNQFHKDLKKPAKAYIQEMDFEEKYVDEMFSTPSGDIKWINFNDILDKFSGYIPSMDEYLYGIFQRSMPRKEVSRLYALSRIAREQPDRPVNEILSNSQYKELVRLEKLERELEDCKREIGSLEHRKKVQKWLKK